MSVLQTSMQRERNGEALMQAFQACDVPAIEGLLGMASGLVRLSMQDSKGMTILHHAARLVQPELVRMILEKGDEAAAMSNCATFYESPSYWLPIHCLADAASRSKREHDFESKHLDCTKLLVEAMSNNSLDKLTGTGQSALFVSLPHTVDGQHRMYNSHAMPCHAMAWHGMAWHAMA